jgi:serine/threonine protein kinase
LINCSQKIGRLGHAVLTSKAKVAVKSVRLSSVASVLALDREIVNMRRLSHPNIRRLIEVTRRKDNNIVVMRTRRLR